MLGKMTNVEEEKSCVGVLSNIHLVIFLSLSHSKVKYCVCRRKYIVSSLCLR